MSILASFWKLEACGQTELPDRSVLKGQKLVENAKSQKFKCDILSNFQTMCKCQSSRFVFFLMHWTAISKKSFEFLLLLLSKSTLGNLKNKKLFLKHNNRWHAKDRKLSIFFCNIYCFCYFPSSPFIKPKRAHLKWDCYVKEVQKLPS